MGSNLLDILTRLRLQPPDAGSPSAVARGQLDLLMARVAALTEVLKGGRSEEERLAARLLLADLGLVVAQLRGEANALAATLDEAITSLRAGLDQPLAGQ